LRTSFRIEATSTSPFFGLKDDIAIRVRSERAGRGTVIDIQGRLPASVRTMPVPTRAISASSPTA